MTSKIVLGIETAISDGGLALIQGNDILASSGGVSRAESLLLGIESVVANAGVRISEIGAIAVSRGPGSFTGIRIGIATALGLARSISKECIGVSLFSAIAGPACERDVSVVISLGRHRYGIQDFEANREVLNGPVSVSKIEMYRALDQRKASRIVFCGDEDERSELSQFANVEVVTQDLATLIARRAGCPESENVLEPIYLGK